MQQPMVTNVCIECGATFEVQLANRLRKTRCDRCQHERKRAAWRTYQRRKKQKTLCEMLRTDRRCRPTGLAISDPGW